jgi:predicted RNA-binding protein YlxR (DUF448 family)
MAAASSTASDTAPTGPHGPIRTCIGCRQRAAATELLRVVVAPETAGEAISTVVPDPRRRSPGRGAWLHPDRRCAELAQRRRAFNRALRVPGAIDPAPVFEYVAPGADTASGTPQEMKS